MKEGWKEYYTKIGRAVRGKRGRWGRKDGRKELKRTLRKEGRKGERKKGERRKGERRKGERREGGRTEGLKD